MAFLRGVNVGGHGSVRMETLGRTFVEVGLDQVETHRASGNVVFETPRRDLGMLRRRLETDLAAKLGYEVAVFLRSGIELDELVRLDPFAREKRSPGVPYVTFLHDAPDSVPHLPTRSGKSDVEVFFARGPNIFCWGLRVGEHFGFPNQFVERLFGQPGTTRNWGTVRGVAPSTR